ncbi:MAG: hypothetical protein JW821_17925 [Deltaproteobacteria bacterium]|nr:hypothetical protein [Deltaproteobacteria bacterium]
MEKVIKSGKIRKRSKGMPIRELPYDMILLDESYLDEIMELQATIVKGLSRADMLEAFPRDFMKRHLGSQGIALGILVEGDLVAFRCVYFPERDDREWNLGIDIGLPDAELDRVANLQMVCVHPAYRGNSLAYRMNMPAIRAVRDLKRYCHLCATVSPYNYWNIRILLRSGFAVRKLKDKYGGKLRYVVHQDLRRPPRAPFREEAVVRLTDIERQREMLAQGFNGVKIREIRGFRARERQDLAHGYELVFAR